MTAKYTNETECSDAITVTVIVIVIVITINAIFT